MKKPKAVVIEISSILRKHLQAIGDQRHDDYDGDCRRRGVIIQATSGDSQIWEEIEMDRNTLDKLIKETAKRRVMRIFRYLQTNRNIPADAREKDIHEIFHMIEVEKLTYDDISTTETEFISVVGQAIPS